MLHTGKAGQNQAEALKIQAVLFTAGYVLLKHRSESPHINFWLGVISDVDYRLDP